MALKILLADDSMTAQKMGQKILVDAGHTVIAVSNGAAAVKKIASEKPDMAVLDIYMPGYTGLEVCERVRAAQETSKIPVLLTVGKMEMGTFKPEDATRVKADGVIIKPFEASDLLAAIKKIEEKLAAAPAAAAAEYERTQKINVAEILKQDTSYQEWQVSADEHKDEDAAEAAAVDAAAKRKMEVPSDMAGGAAMMDMLGDEPVEAQAAKLESAPAPAASTSAPQRDPEIEPTSAKHEADLAHAPDPHFEPTVSQERVEVAHAGQDPALVTDASEMASAFVTKFGVDNPEPIVVGVAADANIAGLYSDGAASAEAAEHPTDDTPTQDVSAPIARMRDLERQGAPVDVVDRSDSALAASLPDDDFDKRVAAAMNSYEQPTPAAGAAPESAPQPTPEPEPPPMAAAAAAEPAPVAASAWAAHEASVEHHEATVSLDQEMLKAFSASVPVATEPAAPEPEPEPPPVAAAPVAPVTATNAPDMELATAMAAAVAPDSPPMAAAAAAVAAAVAAGNQTVVDPARLADAIHRALDRLKPELIANIAKELEQK